MNTVLLEFQSHRKDLLEKLNLEALKIKPTSTAAEREEFRIFVYAWMKKFKEVAEIIEISSRTSAALEGSSS